MTAITLLLTASRKSFPSYYWLLCLFVFLAPSPVRAQNPPDGKISGLLSVCTDGIEYYDNTGHGAESYSVLSSVECGLAYDDVKYAWKVDGGKVVSSGGVNDDNADIVWYNGVSKGHIEVKITDNTGSSNQGLQCGDVVVADIVITTNTTRAGTAYGTRVVTPGINTGSISLVDFNGGIEGWEYSEDGINWFDLGQAGKEQIDYENLKVATSFRARMSTCTSGNTNSRSGLCQIRIAPAESNWIESTAYDDNGAITAASKSYFDANGSLLQSQTKDITKDRVLASQPLLGRYNEPIGSTLPAPIFRSKLAASASFAYTPLFVRSASNTTKAYDYQDFDTDATINNPSAIDNTINGTLGWYYSANNTLEPLTASTAYPYTRTESAFDRSTGVVRSTLPGDAFRLGQNHEAISGSFGVVNELNDYLVLRAKYFPVSEAGENPISLAKQASLSVVVDANRSTKGISIQDKEGRVVMTALPGTTSVVTNEVDLTRVYYYKKSQLPANSITGTNILIEQTNINVTLLDQNGQSVYAGSTDMSSGTNPLRNLLQSTPNWQLVSTVEFDVIYVATVDSRTTSVKVPCYENKDQTLVNFALLQSRIVTVTLKIPDSNYKVVNTVTGSDVTASVKNGTALPDGFYQLTVLYGSIRLSYMNGYAELAYNFYNQKGQLLGSLSPKGVMELQTGSLQAPTNPTLAAGLMTWLPLNQASGTAALDASGNNNSGQLVNGGTWKTADGVIGGALELSGSASLELPLTGNGTTFTFSWWTKPNQLSDWNQTLTINYGWGDFYCHTSSNGAMYAGTSLNTRLVTGAGVMRINEWQQFTFTFAGGVGKLYRNGQLVGSGTGMPNPGVWNTLKLGYGGWNGLVDEFRVYNRALAHSEVQELHHTRLPFFTQYEYDTQGHLLAQVEPDAGRTEFLYRADGKLRFSQNAKQRTAGAYSYVGYDAIGRVFEIGEALGNGTSFASLRNDHAAYLESIGSVANGGSGLASNDNLRDAVRTTYDLSNAEHNVSGYQQKFIAGRVSMTAKYSTGSVYNGFTLSSRTWYSYDDQGQTTWQIQQTASQPARTIDYAYDFGGRALTVCYQKGTPLERLTHYYTYDADKRLSKVETGLDDPAAQVLPHTEQARYEYYLHGPLKRVVYGTDLQGTDYTYTAQGWLKSINDGDIARDPSQDGTANTYLPDLFGTSLQYYPNDYASRSITATTLSISNTPAQYSGNIQGTMWQTPGSPLHMYGYGYDPKGQLLHSTYGRLTSSATRQYSFSPYTNAAISGSRPFFEGDMAYDLNGNLTHLKRTSETGTNLMNIDYQYLANTNKLAAVKTGSTSTISYTYDALGQMTSQQEADVSKSKYLDYNSAGLVTKIYQDEAKTKTVAEYTYDEFGQRLQQKVYANPAIPTVYTTTSFVRDGAGNELATYIYSSTTNQTTLYEQPIYGSGRLGTYRRQRDEEPAEQLYELNDQLGNTRVVFRRPQTHEYVLSMEEARSQQEREDFSGPDETTYDQVYTRDYSRQNSEYGSESSMRLSRANFTPIGPTKTLVVQRGDRVQLEVWAAYPNASGGVSGRSSLLLAGAAAGFNGTLTRTSDGKPTSKPLPAWQQLLSKLSVGVSVPLTKLATRGVTGTPPNAALQYVLRRQRDGAFLRNGSIPVNASSEGNWALLTLDVDITETEPSTLEISVQNYDRVLDVYFDDLKVKYTEGAVVQENHFYAYGQRILGGATDFMSWERKDRHKYRHGYQGQYATADDESGYDAFELRMYDSRIGRWTSTDPYGQYYSPFVGLGNNPVNSTDPDGGYSLIGATWRWSAAVLRGSDVSEIYQSAEEWGFQENGNASFGDCKHCGQNNASKLVDVAIYSIPFSDPELYFNLNYKTTLPYPGTNAKLVVPYGINYSSIKGWRDITPAQSYMNYKMGPVDLRVSEQRSANSPQFRALVEVRKFRAGTAEGKVQLDLNVRPNGDTWFGGRINVEQKLLRNTSVEANVGARAKLDSRKWFMATGFGGIIPGAYNGLW